MSNSIFIIVLIIILYGLYYSINRKWKKRELELNDFAYDMQREFAQKTETLNKGVDYYSDVKVHYESQGYTVSKHPDFPTDFIAKKEKDIFFIRVQSPSDNQDITANRFQVFVGQTVLYALDNPLYASYTIHWSYVCSKMMCDQSARIFMKRYENRLQFDLIETS